MAKDKEKLSQKIKTGPRKTPRQIRDDFSRQVAEYLNARTNNHLDEIDDQLNAWAKDADIIGLAYWLQRTGWKKIQQYKRLHNRLGNALLSAGEHTRAEIIIEAIQDDRFQFVLNALDFSRKSSRKLSELTPELTEQWEQIAQLFGNNIKVGLDQLFDAKDKKTLHPLVKPGKWLSGIEALEVLFRGGHWPIMSKIPVQGKGGENWLELLATAWLEDEEIKQAEKRAAEIQAAREREQFPRPPDNLTGLFSPGASGALVPVEKKTINKHILSLVSIRSTQKLKKRQLSLCLPLDERDRIRNFLIQLNPNESKEALEGIIQKATGELSPEGLERAAQDYQVQAIRELTHLLGPRGLVLFRAIQREIWFNIQDGTADQMPRGLGLMFFCNEDRVLRTLYPDNPRRPERVKEYKTLLARMVSGDIMLDTIQLFRDGKQTQEINVSSRLLVPLAEVDATNIPEGRREQAQTHRGEFLMIPKSAQALFNYGGTNWHAWGDPAFLAMNTATQIPYGTLIQDWIETKLQVGWFNHQGKQSWSLNTLLADLNLLDQYLYPGGDTTQKPWPAYRRNDWIKKVLKQITKTFEIKHKSGLWKTTLLKDPDWGHWRTIPHFLDWLKTPDGRKALKKSKVNNHGDRVEGALRFVLQVEIGPNHKLNTRHRISPEERQKRIASGKRKARAKVKK